MLGSVDGKYKERDYCILVLFLNCGLRLSELVSINYNDIRDNNTITITGKGNKQRTIYLNGPPIFSFSASYFILHGGMEKIIVSAVLDFFPNRLPNYNKLYFTDV